MTDAGSQGGSKDAQVSPAGARGDAHRPALAAMPTSEVVLQPEFLAALKQVAPRKKRPTFRWIVGGALLVALVSIAAVPSARRAVVARVRGLASGSPAAQPQPSASVDPTASSAPPGVAVPSVSAPAIIVPVASTPAPVASASTSTSSGPTKPNKPRRPSH